MNARFEDMMIFVNGAFQVPRYDWTINDESEIVWTRGDPQIGSIVTIVGTTLGQFHYRLFELTKRGLEPLEAT